MEEMRTRLGRKKLIILRVPERGSLQASQGKTPVWSRDGRQERGESLGQSLIWDFPGKGKAGQSKQLKTG